MDIEERRKFAMTSGPVESRIGDSVLVLFPRVFSSGSVGWYAGGKVSISGFKCQVSLCCTVVGSKPGESGEQNSTGPEKPPGASQTLFEAEFAEPPAKPRRKRS